MRTNLTYFSNFNYQQSKPIFARHETFHVRYNWLKKGVENCKINQKIFYDEDSPVLLGVGKNMVSSIKYWCTAFKLIYEKDNAFFPTDFALTLFDSYFGDEYLQDKVSLWLLHWEFLKRPCFATTWDFFFNHFNKNIFSVNDLLEELKKYLIDNFPSHKVSESSLKKDVLCLLRMYCSEDNIVGNIEETINSPFTELFLINQYEEKGLYIINFGKKPGLSSELILAVCLDFAYSINKHSKSISISRLLNEKGSPGLIFKLTESALYEAIEDITYKYNNIKLSDSSGLVQLIYESDPLEIANTIMRDYYINQKINVQK